MKWKMRGLLGLAVTVFIYPAMAETQAEILTANTRAIVYLEVDDASGKPVDAGSGFIVSHDGYILTVAHIKADPTQTMWAVIGQRAGTRFPLDFRDSDETSDVALWQLPKSAMCRYSTTLGTAGVKQFNHVLAVGFPGKEGLTPSPVGIVDTSSSVGNYKTDGYLQEGNSGGPVFNSDGLVVALVQGGTRPGTSNNDLVPIAPAIALLKKHAVGAGYDQAVPFPDSCREICPDTSRVISWKIEEPWTANSGELPGGHNQSDECNAKIAETIAARPGSHIDLAPGENQENVSGKWEKSHKDFLGGMHYTYYCKGTLRAGPIYAMRQSSACPLVGY